MVPRCGDGMNRRADVLLDVTSLISAEDFLLAVNRRSASEDPFARQCFVEVIQSLILMSRVYVAHPVLLSPAAEDFGGRPLLLRSLVRAGLLHPLCIDAAAAQLTQQLEDGAVRDLNSGCGLDSLTRFIRQTSSIDQINSSQQPALLARIRDWSEFQKREVHNVSGHHAARIPTRDGVEDDSFGEWARAAAVVLRGAIDQIAAPGQGRYLTALLARTMKYRTRAEAAGVSYQSHPIRRDFSLTFDMTRNGATEATVLDLIQAVRGVHDSLANAAGPDGIHRVRLLQLELPLLGGRLWTDKDLGRLNEEGWIDLVVERMSDYRMRAADLRYAIERCTTQEDYLRLARDIDEVKRRLLDNLGLRRSEPSAMERDLIDSVASVASLATGVPIVSGMWFTARSLGKQFAHPGAQPYQRFLYREFRNAWRRAGK